MENFYKIMIILFNFTMVLGFIASIGVMKELSSIFGLIMLIMVVCLTGIFNYYEVIKHMRVD